MKKLTFIQIISVSMMLFAIFFGAGNMIFPPAMGQLAGTSYISALAGFILTDAGIAILGVTAVVLAGTSMSDLGNLVSRRFALVLSVGVYMLIGPLFALPRTGSVSFEIALLPYIGENNAILWSLLFTAAFFGLTYYLSSNPSRIVDVVGKYLTPVLLISILAIFIASRRADYRQVAKLALPSGIFQINEPILFGLPIIMNPVMFIPFVLVQPILAAITLAAYYMGIIPPVTNIAPWTMPTGLGAFFNTNGSVAALLVALFNLGIATLIYLPFVVVANKAQNAIDKEESEEDIANALKF